MDLYSDDRTLESVKLLADTDEALYNLWEDIKCLKERNAELEVINNMVAHIGVDFGYGPYKINGASVAQARKLVESK